MLALFASFSSKACQISLMVLHVFCYEQQLQSFALYSSEQTGMVCKYYTLITFSNCSSKIVCHTESGYRGDIEGQREG